MKSFSSSTIVYSNGKDTFTSKKEKNIINGVVTKNNLDYFINEKKISKESFKAILQKKYNLLKF